MLELYFDGCCLPKNPGGYIGAGYVIFQDNTEINRGSTFRLPSPLNSNNVAEYLAVNLGLTYLLENNMNELPLYIFGDSKMCVNQMNCYWGINDGMLYTDYAKENTKLLSQFKKRSVQHIYREYNSLADEVAMQDLLLLGVKDNINRKKREVRDTRRNQFKQIFNFTNF